MARRKMVSDSSPGPKLKDVHSPVIEVECRRCGTKGSYARAELVKTFGAEISFARLRRRTAMGCEHMTGSDGDLCQTRFPCLDPDRP